MKDFFVSYNTHDRNWAVWIAWQLEEAGHSVVIQAWDFVGNWVLEMDRAMRGTKQTIAVLSPHYLQALYTQTEWANALQRDPTGMKDVLIPFRVAKCEPDGYLAQIVYTDLIDLSEDQARDRLLKRVSGQRGKPDVAPGFPGQAAASPAGRSVPQRPPYPAKHEDLLRLQRFRIIARDWRDRYASRIDALQLAAKQAHQLESAPPADVTDELVSVVSLAAEVADDFSRLQLDELAFANRYGLRIHEAVLQGSALTVVQHAQKNLQRWQARGAGAVVSRLRKAHGLRSPVDAYGFENIGRVLAAAVNLSRFDLNRLPRGFIDAGMPEAPKDLRGHGPLVLAYTGDARLHLLAPSAGGPPLGVFAARNLMLDVVAAQVNAEGSLDMVASDSQHLYYWSASGSAPVQQVHCEGRVMAGAFLSDEPGAEAVTVASDGSIRVLAADGLRETMPANRYYSLEPAAVWVDPLDTQQWYVLRLDDKGELYSLHRGRRAARRGAEDLWNDSAFDPPVPELGRLWTGNDSLTLGSLGGLPCAVVKRGSDWGSALRFVDPATLQILRRPMRLPNRPAAPIALALIGDRWLLGTCRESGSEPVPRVLVWDLTDDGPEATRPVGACFDSVGYAYDPVVLFATAVEFRAAFVLEGIEHGPKRCNLCLLDWPAGTTRIVAEQSGLHLWPVRQPRAV